MATRARPLTITTRVTAEEKAIVEALAAMEDTTVSIFLHDVLVPRVRQLMAERVGVSPPQKSDGR